MIGLSIFYCKGYVNGLVSNIGYIEIKIIYYNFWYIIEKLKKICWFKIYNCYLFVKICCI